MPANIPIFRSGGFLLGADAFFGGSLDREIATEMLECESLSEYLMGRQCDYLTRILEWHDGHMTDADGVSEGYF